MHVCIRMWKRDDLSDLECVVGARRPGLNILETADLLIFSHTAISGVKREWSKVVHILYIRVLNPYYANKG